MARYIDADKFISWLRIGQTRSPFQMCYTEFDVKMMIDMQPSADVVEVIRCKDCKYWNEIEMECRNDYVAIDNEGGASFSLNFYLDDFCSYGERKENNDL